MKRIPSYPEQGQPLSFFESNGLSALIRTLSAVLAVFLVAQCSWAQVEIAQGQSLWVGRAGSGKIALRAWPWGPVVASLNPGDSLRAHNFSGMPPTPFWREVVTDRMALGVVCDFQLLSQRPVENPLPSIPGLVLARNTRGLGILLRSEPRANSNALRVIPETTTPFAVNSQSGSWARASVSDSTWGWIPIQALHPFFGELADILPGPWTPGRGKAAISPGEKRFPTFFRGMEFPWVSAGMIPGNQEISSELPSGFGMMRYSSSLYQDNLCLLDRSGGRVAVISENGLYCDPASVFDNVLGSHLVSQGPDTGDKPLFPKGIASRGLALPGDSSAQGMQFEVRGYRLLAGIASSGPGRVARIRDDGGLWVLDTARCRMETYDPNGIRTGFVTLVSNNVHLAAPGVFTDLCVISAGTMALFERSCRCVEFLNSRGLVQTRVEAMAPDTMLHPWKGQVQDASPLASASGVLASSASRRQAILLDQSGNVLGLASTGGAAVPAAGGVAWLRSSENDLLLESASLIPFSAHNRKAAHQALGLLEKGLVNTTQVKALRINGNDLKLSGNLVGHLCDSTLTPEGQVLFLALVRSLESGLFRAALLDSAGRVRRISETMNGFLLGTGAEAQGFRLHRSGEARYFCESEDRIREISLWEAL